MMYIVFFFKQKTAYEITRRDWSSDVCSSDLPSSTVSKPSSRISWIIAAPSVWRLEFQQVEKLIMPWTTDPNERSYLRNAPLCGAPESRLTESICRKYFPD